MIFGVLKSLALGRRGWLEAFKSGAWTLLIGGIAAGAAFGVVRLLDVR